MPIDIARARADTPGCAEVLHFNNAGAALMPRVVLDAIKDHLDLEARIGGYEAADREEPRWERAYDAIAALIGCGRDEVAIVENATRAWDMAFYAVPLQAGDRVLTVRAEYMSNYLALLQVARKTGATIELIPGDESGQADVAALARMMDERVRLVVVTHASGSGGLVNPVEAIGRVVKESRAWFLVDACQSAGQIPLDVDRIGCHMLSSTGRKFLRGPRGVGFLYVRRAILDELEPPFVDMRAADWTSPGRYQWRRDARRFENWETNYATKIGLAVAVDYALGFGLAAIHQRTTALAEQLRAALGRLRGVRVHDLGIERSGIVTFTAEGRDAAALREALLGQGMNTSVSRVEHSRLDLGSRGLERLVRASPHYYNTEEEVERFAAAVAALA